MIASRRIFPAQTDPDMNGFKFTGAAPGSASGEFVTWEQFQVALDQIIGVRWNTASSSPVLEQVDAYGTVITQKTHAWFDAHPIYGNMWRCTLTAAGVPTFGANARGDGLNLDGSDGNVMVRIPKCYVKAQLIDTYQYVWVSPVEFTGFEVHPWFLQRGGTERNEAYMGAYLGCLKIDTATGVKSLISKTGGQPFTGGEIVEVNFNSGSVEPQIGEVLTGATSLMTGTVEGYYLTGGSFLGGDAAGKVYLRMVSRRFTFDTGSHEPVVGETITGVSSGATGKVSKVVVTSGSWATSDAAGYVLLEGGSGNGSAFTVGQNFRDPDSNVIGVSRSIGDTLGEFTVGGAFDGSTGGADMMTCQSVGSALSLTRQLAETYANNIGSSRWGYADIWGWDLITRILYPIEYCNWNSQSTSVGIGQGIVNKNVGRRFNGELNGALSADANIATNGTGTGTGIDGLTPSVYRGIENPWGNCWQFIIGLDATDSAYRILKRDGTGTPACPLASGSYESTVAAPYTYDVTLRPDGYAKTTLFEDLTKYLMIPNLGDGSSSTYLCDYAWWHRAGQTNILLAGGAWRYGATAGVGCRILGYVSSISDRDCAARCEFV